MIAAGRLNRRIRIERATTTTDEFGALVETWTELTTVWVEVLPLSDGERWKAQEVAATATHRFRIRWGTGVLPTDRIVFGDRTFEISAVKELGLREGSEITAAARAD